MSELHPDEELERSAALIDDWLATLAASDETVEAVHREDGDEPRWYVRMRGDEKEHHTIWLTLGQRTLRYELYVLPAPEDGAATLYEVALRRNDRMVGAHFAIGLEDALFLRGELPVGSLSEPELDRIVGSLLTYAEQSFPVLARIGFPSRFTD